MVPLVDLSRRGLRFADAFAAAARAIAESGQFLFGGELAALEVGLASFVGTSHVAAVSSGASALQLGLAALGVGPGDEVIVPAFTAVPTASAVAVLGAAPVFVDVDPATACLDGDRVDAAVTPLTKAIVVVHLYGYPAPLPETSLPVVQDAAQAQGAIEGATTGSFTAYSFYPTKTHGGIGDGGAVATDDPDIDNRVRLLRTHGMTQQYVHEAVSQNHRMSEIEAAWLNLTLPSLREDVDRRRHIAARYREAAPHLRWQAEHDLHAHHLCVFRTRDRHATVEQLRRAGVASAVHYPVALPDQPAYRGWATAPCPEATSWARECLSVPCFPEMTDAEIVQVVTALRQVAA
ncbi:MAG: DegT/DnrJ/EryC1/StrS family aminotransferase [Ilumatobacteraceae bacterium]